MNALFSEHGLAAVFCVVLLEQLGLPIPALPVLLLAGALAAGDAMFAVWALACALVASSVADYAWYFAGRRLGHRVLNLLCRISLSPDSCVRQTESAFERRGVATLVIAKFVPGLATLAPPLAGALGIRPAAFLIFNGAGAALWAGAGIFGGLVFHDQIDDLVEGLDALGRAAGYFLLAALGLYVALRWWQRHQAIRDLRMARISVDELHALIERGASPLVLDARSPSLRKLHGQVIPGAHAIDLEHVDVVIPPGLSGREVVVYCSCPNDASAVKVARMLKGRGISPVRPLAGGIDAWMAAGLSLVPLDE
ncbi:MAG: VTT domain-containing protein [Zoogloeaceae bacterium]|nr:VTT domain-containing protein [Zoogloeaceae bacterium]